MTQVRNTILFLGSLVWIFIGCTKSFDEKVAAKIEERCSNQSSSLSCEIVLKEVTDFEWDSLYVLNGLMTVNEINEALGFECKCDHLSDNYQRLVFTKDNKIVFQSDYYGADSKVQFRPIKINSEPKFSMQESKFIVVKKSNTLTSGYFYDLYPIGRKK